MSMRRVVVLLLLVAAFSSARVYAEDQSIRLVTEEWPGLIDDASEGPKGILWAVSQEALSEMGYTVTLEFMPWKRALKLVELGQRDGIIGIGHTPERAAKYQFPDKPLMISRTVVVSPAESDFEFEDLGSLEGLSVGVSPGYSYSEEIRNATHFEKVLMPSIKAGIGMLLLNRIDVMLANQFVAAEESSALRALHQLQFSEKMISGGPVYLAFRQNIAPAVVEEFSRQISGKAPTHKLVEQLTSNNP